MATSTTNLGLIKPDGTDKIRIAQINQNMDTLDTKIGAVGNTSLQAQVSENNAAITTLNSKTTTSTITTTAATNFTKRSPCRAKKIGNLVILFLDVATTSAMTIGSSYTTVLTYQTDYKPASDLFGVAYVNGKDVLGVDIYNGEVLVRSIQNSVSLASGDVVRGTFTWIVDD